MRFDTAFSVYIYVAICALIVLSLVLTWRRYYGQLRTSYLLSISLCRVIAVALLFVFALRPYSVEESPDKESFSIGVLTDVSGSMKSSDCDGASRLKTAQDILIEKAWFMTIADANHARAIGRRCGSVPQRRGGDCRTAPEHVCPDAVHLRPNLGWPERSIWAAARFAIGAPRFLN